jgi:hypothetical protein
MYNSCSVCCGGYFTFYNLLWLELYGMARNVLEDGFEVVVVTIQTYGWYAVGLAIALYFSWPHITNLRKQLSLREANDPMRRSVLDAQRTRVRLQQQQSLDHVD